MSPQEKTSMMMSLVSRWQESGMTQVKYAEANNLSVHTFKYWLYKKRKSKNLSGGFVQINDYRLDQEFILYYPNGVELKISSNTPIPVIKSLVNL